jgi:aquaporin-4
MNGSLDDLRTPHFWRAVVGEALGTLIVVLVGCGSCVSWDKFDRDPSSTAPRPPPPIVQIALTFGLTVSTVVWSLHHVGCGHVNPAVTIAMLATRKVRKLSVI